MAGGGGGAWKVAYADFVTAMMAFFMVMWLVGQKEDAKEAIAHYFEEPFDDHAAHAAQKTHPPHTPAHEKKGAGKPKSASDDPHHPEAKKSRILAIHGGERAAFGTVINFQGDSVELDAEGQAQLDLAIPKFVGIPQKIEIRGHVSNRSAAQSDAWKLSYDRALAVMAYLVKHGIQQNRIRLAQAGAHEPLTISGAAGEMERNSRVAVFLLEEFAEDTVGTPEERELRHKADAEPHPETEAAPTDEHTPKFIFRGGSDNAPKPKTKDKGDHGGHGDDHGKKDAHGKADAHAKPAKHDDHGHSAKPAKKDDHGHGDGHGAKPAAKAKAGHH